MKIGVDLIRHLPLFAKLSDADIEAILPFFKLAEYPETGSVIFREGEPGDALFMILEGEVEIRKSIDSGSDKSLATLPAGTFFGEMALLTGETRSATAVSRGARLIQFPRDEFLKLMAQNPEAASLLLGGLVSILAERLRSTSLEVVTLYETGRIISSTRNHLELASGILQRLVDALGAAGGLVLLFNEIVDCFECHAAVPLMPVTTAFSVNTELVGQICALKEPARQNRSNSLSPQDAELGINRQSVLLASFITDCHDYRSGEMQKKVTGAIILVHDTADYFTLPHLTLLQGVAGQVSQALLSSQLLQENESRRAYEQVYVTPDL